MFDLRADPSECVAANRSLCAMACDNADGLCNRWVTAEQALANNASYLKAFSAVCFLTVRDITRIHTNKKAVALVQSAWGGTRIEPTVVMPPAGKEQNNVSVLYNAMVAPFNKLSVRAALWYQGEYLQAMIADWRNLKGMGDFTFMPVMLPPAE
eukprot:gene21315-33468_t